MQQVSLVYHYCPNKKILFFTGREHNFKKYESETVTNFNVTYDYHSIMHYSAYAFSHNEKKTIVPLVSKKNRKFFLKVDYVKVS